MNNIYVLLDEMRESIISIDLSYSRTTELLNLILEIEKAVGENCLLRSQDEWVPVSERLPKRIGVYNVTRKLKEGETIYFISDVSYFDGQNTWHGDVCVNHGRPYLTDIIAWRPRPEPYKGGEQE